MANMNCDCCEKLKAVTTDVDSYQKCVENSLQQISALNIKYEHTVNELSTIINIFEYINLVTDYKNLFSIINDMLIGVLGATSSTIFIYNGGGYKIEASSLSRQSLLSMEKIGQTLLARYKDNREPFILNGEDITDDFSRERDIRSVVCVPLNGKEKRLGIIYLEHYRDDYFTIEAKRYLNTLAIAIRLSLENAQLYAKLEEMALIDGLTGLHNRMFFNKEINNCMDNYKKFGLPFVLTILDIDHFKKVNDNYGHLCGDMVLQEMGELIRQSIRKDDIVCRYGGEEFAIIFRNTQDMSGINLRLEALRVKMEAKRTECNNSEIQVTSSFGVVSCCSTEKCGSVEEVIRRADEALYEAKRSGRNRICIAQ